MDISQEQYNKYREFARNLTKSSFEGDELLHSTLLNILETDTSKINDIDSYVICSLKWEYIRPRTRYKKLIGDFQANWTDLEPHQFEVELNNNRETWIGSRLTNEQLDILMSRLPFFEREVFNLYVMNGFSYRELSNETGIPVSYLYDTVKRAKEEIKKCIKYDE